MLRQFAIAVRSTGGVAPFALMAGLGAAQADVVISTKATANMDCFSGTVFICEPTAVDAVLNVFDLENYLSQEGNVHVESSGENVDAINIVVKGAFATPDSTSLTFDATGAITVDAPVSIGDNTAELQLQSNCCGNPGVISFGSKGRISFANTSDLFNINGLVFQLVGSLPDLAARANANPNGGYALANGYDASADGTYKASPIDVQFGGYFEALGNTISNLSIKDSSDPDVGLFADISGSQGLGVVRNLRLVNTLVTGGNNADVGGIAGTLEGGGAIYQSSVSGKVQGADAHAIGGLVGDLGGNVVSCRSSAKVTGGEFGDFGGLVGGGYGSIVDSYSTGSLSAGSLSVAGGLIGYNDGWVTGSFAGGDVQSAGGSDSGGLVGYNAGSVENSYARGTVSDTGGGNQQGALGGLIGAAVQYGSASLSYATGKVIGTQFDVVGGVAGEDDTEGGFLHTYWNTTTSGLSQGAGNIADDAGMTGLQSKELRSGLPSRFDKKIWKEKGTINRGFPYLRDNPPPR